MTDKKVSEPLLLAHGGLQQALLVNFHNSLLVLLDKIPDFFAAHHELQYGLAVNVLLRKAENAGDTSSKHEVRSLTSQYP